MNIKKKTLLGLFWNGMELVGGRVIQFLVIIILSHYLSPKEFGTIALLIVFIELSRILLDSGFTQALIREKNTTNEDLASVFYFNIFVSFIIYIIFYLLAPTISDFYHFPELTLFSRIAFFAIIINAFGIVQNAILTKNMNFQVLAKRTLITNIIAGCFAILLAYLNFEIWSLIGQILLSSFLRVVMLWKFSSWRPSSFIKLASLKKLFSFSIYLLISNFIDIIVSNIQVLLIGRFYVTTEVGLYSQAKNLSTLPYQTLTSIVKNVTYPGLSTMQNSKRELTFMYKKVIRLSMFVTVPFVVILISIADKLIPFLLGEQWIELIQYFMILSLIGVMYPLYSLSQNIFLAKGNGKLFLKLSVLKRIITLGGVILTIQWSVFALVIAQVITMAFNTLLTMYYLSKEIDYSLVEQLKDIIGVYLNSAIMFIGMFLLKEYFILENDIFYILFWIVLESLLYLFLSILFQKKLVEEIKLIRKNLYK